MPPLPGPPWCSPPPPGPRPNVPPPIGLPPAVASFFWPNPNVLASRRFSEKRPGPVTSLMGIGVKGCPATGASRKQPYAVWTIFAVGAPGQEANAGRVLNAAFPKISCPVVMLNGIPELAMRKGLSRKPYGPPKDPPKKRRSSVKRSATVVLRNVEWVRGNASRAGGVTVRVIQHVKAEERYILNESVRRRNADVAVHNQLILLEDAFGLVLIENLAGRRSYQLPWRNGVGVDEIGVELMVAAGSEISNGQICKFRNLALERHSGLHDIRRPQIRIGLVNRL